LPLAAADAAADAADADAAAAALSMPLLCCVVRTVAGLQDVHIKH
jgi:hypothetical protein